MNPRTLSRMNFRVSFWIPLKFYPSVARSLDEKFQFALVIVVVARLEDGFSI